MPKKTIGIIGGVVALIVIGAFFVLRTSSGNKDSSKPQPTKAPAPVNRIPVSERPYVTLQPKTGRNELEIVIHELKKDAKNVEVVLEYDRNKGVLDAVLKQFTLSTFPFKEMLFMGSKSAGGHITYHDDVIGGKLSLTFDGGKERYALEVPWRYSDTEKTTKELSTSDGRFQVVFESVWNTSKYVVMQSPGLPQPLENEVMAGPYLFRGIGNLPSGNADIKIRLVDEAESVSVFGYDGALWQRIDATLEGKNVTFSSSIYQAYIVTK